MELTKQQKGKAKFLVLVTMLATFSAGLPLYPILGKLQEAMPNVSQTSIQQLATICSMVTMITIFFFAAISPKIPRKLYLSFAVVTVALGGVVSALGGANYVMVLGGRLLVGVGGTVYAAILVATLNQIFSGDERVKVNSYLMTISAALSVMAGPVYGRIAEIDYTLVFWSFLISLALLPVIFVCCPPDEYFKKLEETTRLNSKKKEKAKMPLGVIVLGFDALVVMVANSIWGITAYLFVEEKLIGGPAEIGIAIGLGSAAQVGFSLLAPAFKKWTKHNAMTLTFLMNALSFLIMYIAQDITVYYIGATLLCVALGLWAPLVFAAPGSFVPAFALPMAMSIINFGTRGGEAISPYIYNFLRSVSGAANSIDVFLIVTGLLFVYTVIRFFLIRVVEKADPVADSTIVSSDVVAEN